VVIGTPCWSELRAAAMRNWSLNKWLLCLEAISLIVTLVGTVAVGAIAGEGSAHFSVNGYSAVHGVLQSATIYQNSTVSILMTVNDRIQTAQGTFPITATGHWNGVSNGLKISGLIQRLVGKIQICVPLWCGDANFNGSGAFAGSLKASHADGLLNGTITFTNSPVLQGQLIPFSGSWETDFLVPIPEFRSQSVTFMLTFVAAIVLVSIRRRPTQES
jgi:hypothetical protein